MRITNYRYDKNRIIKAAVAYADTGIGVVPLLGRYPLFEGKELFWTKDPGQIFKIYSEDDRQLNIGIALGSPSNVVAITVESRFEKRAGYDSYVRKYGPLPETLTLSDVALPCHYFYRAVPGHGITGQVQLRDGMFLRGDGEYMLLPPSSYPLPTGEYAFDDSRELILSELPCCPMGAYKLAKERIAHLQRHPLVPGYERIPIYF